MSRPGPRTPPTSPSAHSRSGWRSRRTARPHSSGTRAVARCRRLMSRPGPRTPPTSPSAHSRSWRRSRRTARPPSSTNRFSNSVSTIDVKTRTKNPTDITVGTIPDGRRSRPTEDRLRDQRWQQLGVDDRCQDQDQEPHRHPGRHEPHNVAITPDGKTAFVTNTVSGTVSTIDVKTRTKNPTDITGRYAPARGGVHTGRQDRLRDQQHQRHGVDD